MRRNHGSQLSLFLPLSTAIGPQAGLLSDPNDRNAWVPDPLMRPAWQLDGKTESLLNEATLPTVPEQLCEARYTSRCGTGQVVTLKWDFRTTFPVPLDSAIENGRLYESDLEPENLAALHDEHARHALALLSDVDTIVAAKFIGVDPATGKAPKTEKQRDSLTKLYAERPALLLHSFDVLMDVYGEAFGDDAALAFKQAITSWHAGAEVVRNHATPIYESVTLTPIQPGDEGLSVVRPLGCAAAVGVYNLGHPWHYLNEGDGASPVDVEQIPACDQAAAAEVKLPKNREKRLMLLTKMKDDAERQLAIDKKRYEDLVEEGAVALNDYDRAIAHGGDDDLAWASAVALKYNHISGGRGRLETLTQLLQGIR